ncbi:MAG TPA: N-formylglutamate amidohydrolase [Methylomirabilota bacterium]|nr:N-formylglutamate amidohydrolase [Methylomirabilota bacterium]
MPVDRSIEIRRLLAVDEPPAFVVENEDGASPFFLTCDHAGKLIPRRLGTLGLPAAERERHIAWDIGAGAVSRLLAQRLGATLVTQTYSRLVVDCNRAAGVPSSIVTLSELTEIPANRGLSPDDVALRFREIFDPYHNRIAALLDRRKQQSRPTILVAMHSFTPVFKGVARPWHIGILYHRDRRLAEIMLDLMRREPDLQVGDNQPYTVGDLTDYTVPVHGERRGIPHVEIEMRQDLITDPAGQEDWAERLARVLGAAQQRLSGV